MDDMVSCSSKTDYKDNDALQKMSSLLFRLLYFFNNTKKRTLGLQLATVIFHGISEARPRKTRVSKLRSFLHSEYTKKKNNSAIKTLRNYPTANCSLGEISHRRTLNSQFTSAAHRRPTVMGEDGRICKQISNWFGIISIRFNISLFSAAARPRIMSWEFF